jgi:hypothetical protein
MRRYAAILAAAMRKVAASAERYAIPECPKASGYLRTFHLRRADAKDPEAMRQSVHVLCYRTPQRGVIEIVRVLDARDEPRLYLKDDDSDD